MRSGVPCSCDSRQLSTVGSTSANKPGGMPLWNAARCIPMAGARLLGTAPMGGLTRLAPAYRAGIVLKVTAHSACWRIVLPHGYRDQSATWSGWSWKSSKPGAWKRQPTACAQTTSRFRGQFAGRGAACDGYIPRCGSCSHPGMPLRLPAHCERASGQGGQIRRPGSVNFSIITFVDALREKWIP